MIGRSTTLAPSARTARMAVTTDASLGEDALLNGAPDGVGPTTGSGGGGVTVGGGGVGGWLGAQEVRFALCAVHLWRSALWLPRGIG